MNIRMRQNKKLRNRGNKSYYSFAKKSNSFLEQMGRHTYIKGTDGRFRPSTSIPNIPDQEYEPLEKY